MKNEVRENCIIIDIDGTIADCEHRLYLIHGEDKRWDEFFETAYLDVPMKKNIQFIKNMCKKYKARPVFITGRRSETDWSGNCIVRRDTLRWIEKHFLKIDRPYIKFCRWLNYHFDHSVWPFNLPQWYFSPVDLKRSLFMRTKGDKRKAVEVKRDILERNKFTRNYHVVAVFEDGGESLAMYKKELSKYGTQFFLVNEDGDMVRC